MNQLTLPPVTMCLSKAALAAGTTTTLSTTGTTLFTIRGKAYTKAAITNGATPTTDYADNLPFTPILPNFGSVFLVGFDPNGNMKCTQGDVLPLDSSGAFVNAPNFGPQPNDFCPIGYIIVKSASGGPAGGWTFGSSNMSGVSNVTQTFVDVITVPDRPQVS